MNYKKKIAYITMAVATLFIMSFFFNECKPVLRIKRPIIKAGVRASIYGVQPPFPTPSYWAKTSKSMASLFPNSVPSLIWIVGIIDRKKTMGCKLNFPPSGRKYPKIIFAPEDKNRPYLEKFEREGIKVWLQVEPGKARVEDLIKVVMERYSSYKCVIGFGVDVEWYRWSEKNQEGVAVSDEEARRWRTIVRSYNRNYKLFLKHWETSKMPSAEREGIVFIDDSQQFNSLEEMVREFVVWGKYFYPAEVGFQVGYPADRKWWGKLGNPPRDIGKVLLKNIPNLREIYWVDFTMEELWPR